MTLTMKTIEGCTSNIFAAGRTPGIPISSDAASHSLANKISNFWKSELWHGYPLLPNLAPSASPLAKSANKSMSHPGLTISHPEPRSFEFLFRTLTFRLFSRTNKQTNSSFCWGKMNVHLTRTSRKTNNIDASSLFGFSPYLMDAIFDRANSDRILSFRYKCRPFK